MTLPDRIPTNWRNEYLHVERSKQQLQKDLTVAFDRIGELRGTIRSFKTMLWIAGLFLSALGAIVVMLANVVLDWLK